MLFLCTTPAGAVHVFSSSTYNGSDVIYDLAINQEGEIIAAGFISNDFWLAKYDSSLGLISDITLDGYGGGKMRISSGSIYVAGKTDSSDQWVGKFDSNLVLQSSAAYNDPSFGVSGTDLLIASSGEIFVSGSLNGVHRFIAKYSSGLVLISTWTLATGSVSSLVESGGHIFATGSDSPLGNNRLWVGKFDMNLNLISSTTLNGELSGFFDLDGGEAIVADEDSNLYVCGIMSFSATGPDVWLGKFNSGLTLISSTTRSTSSGNGSEGCKDIAKASEALYVVGDTWAGGPSISMWVAKYDLNLVLKSSAIIDGGLADQGKAVAVDALGNVYAGGSTNQQGNAVAILSKHPPLSVPDGFSGTASPTSIVWEWSDTPGEDSYLLMSDANGAISGTMTQNAVSFTETGLLPKTAYTRRVKALDSVEGLEQASSLATVTTLPLDDSSETIPGETGGTVAIDPASGPITLEIPAGVFSGNIGIELRYATNLGSLGNNSPLSRLWGTGVGVEIVSGGVQPSGDLRLVVSYRDSDVSGLNEANLVIARYDPVTGTWLPLPSTADPSSNRVSAATGHLSTFQMMERAPSSTVATAKAYPNPLRPAEGHTGITITNVPAGASVVVYTLVGERVRELTADNIGQVVWDGKNLDGRDAASGVYLVLIQGAGERKSIKVAITR